jgi:hypothetical protein
LGIPQESAFDEIALVQAWGALLQQWASRMKKRSNSRGRVAAA